MALTRQIAGAILVLAVCAAHAFAGDGDANNNPYRELTPAVRDLVAATMTPRADFLANPNDETRQFIGWYQKTQCAGGTSCQPQLSAYAEFAYNHGKDRSERIAIACVLSTLKSEFPGFPAEPGGLGRIDWAGSHGEITFQPVGSDAGLQQTLRDHGYSAGNGACIRSNCLWGVRSGHVGRALHWKRERCGSVPCNGISVHIDLWNPGTTVVHLDHAIDGVGVAHYLHDDWQRKRTHETPEMLVGDPNACGVGVHDLMAVVEHTDGDIRGRLQAMVGTRLCENH